MMTLHEISFATFHFHLTEVQAHDLIRLSLFVGTLSISFTHEHQNLTTLGKTEKQNWKFCFFSQSIPCLFIDTICKTERIASVCLQFIIPDHILGETQVNTE